jgi:hypothetical protein
MFIRPTQPSCIESPGRPAPGPAHWTGRPQLLGSLFMLPFSIARCRTAGPKATKECRNAVTHFFLRCALDRMARTITTNDASLTRVRSSPANSDSDSGISPAHRPNLLMVGADSDCHSARRVASLRSAVSAHHIMSVFGPFSCGFHCCPSGIEHEILRIRSNVVETVPMRIAQDDSVRWFMQSRMFL